MSIVLYSLDISSTILLIACTHNLSKFRGKGVCPAGNGLESIGGGGNVGWVSPINLRVGSYFKELGLRMQRSIQVDRLGNGGFGLLHA